MVLHHTYGSSICSIFVFCIGIAFVIGAGKSSKITSSKDCHPWPVLIQVGKHAHIGFVEVHRCLGHTEGYANHYKCVSTGYENITVSIPPLNSEQVVNHTSCAMKCVCTVNGGKCQGNHFYDVFCLKGRWNHSLCACVDDCTEKTRNAKSETSINQQREKGKVSFEVFAGCLLGELFIVAAAAYCCCQPKPRKYDSDDEDTYPDKRETATGQQHLSNVRRRLSSIKPGQIRCGGEGSVSLLLGCERE